jgi:predicted  nucleic acid-binding Zn-ribbon protein
LTVKARRRVVGWQALHLRVIDMAKKDKLTQVAVRIGTAVGKADRTAHKVAKAGAAAKKELEDISKQVEALKRQLQKTTKRLKAALS